MFATLEHFLRSSEKIFRRFHVIFFERPSRTFTVLYHPNNKHSKKFLKLSVISMPTVKLKGVNLKGPDKAIFIVSSKFRKRY